MEALFLSKMAVIELCGWIELSFDEVILKCAKRNLKNEDNIKFVEQQVIKRTNGFDYDIHFRPMMIKLIGLVRLEVLESKIDDTKLTKLKAALSRLKVERDREAHTYVKGTTRTISAPSIMLSLFSDVDLALAEFERELKVLKF